MIFIRRILKRSREKQWHRVPKVEKLPQKPHDSEITLSLSIKTADCPGSPYHFEVIQR